MKARYAEVEDACMCKYKRLHVEHPSLLRALLIGNKAVSSDVYLDQEGRLSLQKMLITLTASWGLVLLLRIDLARFLAFASVPHARM
jgi:hypothetical protein